MFTPGTVVDGRYEILGPLGVRRHGPGVSARGASWLGDEVALKALHAGDARRARGSRDRFLRESRACAQLRHPNIVGLPRLRLRQRQPAFYMVMELLSGPSLREEIDLESPMSPARVVASLDAVASALQLAHDRGITHRDLKPANIVAHRV